FCQAEDGIRDLYVAGVQTCALPIFDMLAGASGGLIELVILDLIMPGMDGLEFLERMTAVRGHVPVVVETAQGSIETVIKAMRAEIGRASCREREESEEVAAAPGRER